jgi:hypothetical protein
MEIGMSKFKFVIVLILFSFSAFATVRQGDCPQEFIGELKLKLEGNYNQKGYEIVQYVVIVELLKFGPFKIEESKNYKIQLKNGKICWIEQL